MKDEDDIRAVVEAPEGAREEDSPIETDAKPSCVEADIDEELSESLRPAPPPVVSVRPSERPPESSLKDAKPSSLSLGEHLTRARRNGTWIWYAGVFLWAYLVVGEYVVGPGLPEALGWSAFAGIVVGSFLHGANRIGTSAMGKGAAIAVASVIGTVIFLSSLVGSSSRAEYQGLSLILLLASVGLILFGLRSSRGGLPSPKKKGAGFQRVAIWVLFFSNTALIMIALLAQASGSGAF